MEEAERLCDRVAILDHGRIIDGDTPAELVRRHCPERSVIFSADGSGDRGFFDQIAGIDAVEYDGKQYSLRGTGNDFISEVIHCLSANSVRISDFRTVVPTLEDVFLRVTGHSVRS
jgi:ABC-2 type transport system ATP-binding protein